MNLLKADDPVSIHALLEIIDTKIESEMGTNLQKIEAKFDQFEAKFDNIRLDMNSKFDMVNSKFDMVNTMFNKASLEMRNEVSNSKNQIILWIGGILVTILLSLVIAFFKFH